MGLILDTSVFISAERGRFDLQAFLNARPSEAVVISAVTASELLEGVHRATAAIKAKRSALVEQWLADFAIADFDLEVARTHSRLSAQLAAIGTKVGAHDLLIAATAMHRGYTVVTQDARSFPRVSGLRVELV